VTVNGIQRGAATTRNYALVDAQAPLVVNLDADDVLAAGALSALLETFDGPDVAFAFGWQELLVDGRPVGRGWPPVDCPYPPGRIEAGAIPSLWLSTSHHWVSASIAMYRRDRVLAEGGWGALAVAEDLATLLPIADRHPGVYVDRCVGWYRRHPLQTTASPHPDSSRCCRFIAESLLNARVERGVPVDGWAFTTRDGVRHRVPHPPG
jgi:glycosyltransferase involved in cell wall biosynthesis